MKILVCCKEPARCQTMLQTLSLLALPKDSEICLLTVVPPGKPQDIAGAVVPAIAGWRLDSRIRQGNPIQEILAELETTSYDLIVLGWKHRRVTLGSVVGRLFRNLRLDVLLVQDPPESIDRVLICSGAERTSMRALEEGGRLLSGSSADITILHVMSQIAFSESSPGADLMQNADDAMRRRTREGVHLSQAMETLRRHGLTGNLHPVIRHGLVVDEVEAELRAGGHDLLILGSRLPEARGSWMDRFLEDVAWDLASRAPCSVLILRPDPD